MNNAIETAGIIENEKRYSGSGVVESCHVFTILLY